MTQKSTASSPQTIMLVSQYLLRSASGRGSSREGCNAYSARQQLVILMKSTSMQPNRRRKRKAVNFPMLNPLTQLLIQGQWWSYLLTHTPQMKQWNSVERNEVRHSGQHGSSTSIRSFRGFFGCLRVSSANRIITERQQATTRPSQTKYVLSPKRLTSTKRCVGINTRWKRKRKSTHCRTDGFSTRYTTLKLHPIFTFSQLLNSSSSTRAMSPRPCSLARSIARLSSRFISCRFTPFSSIRFTTSLCPPLTAYISGVHPSRFRESTSIPSTSSRQAVRVAKPCLAALCRMVSPK